MRCKTKQEEDSRSTNVSKKFGADLRVSSHYAARKTQRAFGEIRAR
jgi:hypothetical protein